MVCILLDLELSLRTKVCSTHLSFFHTVKFMAVDDEVGIQGNGNQDTQSWFHSQEINVMIDNKKIVNEWMHALVSNQNTELYGKVGLDGIWRDEAGHTVSPATYPVQPR